MGGKYAQRLCIYSKPKTSTPPTSNTRTRENSDRSTWNASRGKGWEPQSKNIMKKEAGRCEKEPNHGFWKRTYSHWKQTKKEAAYWMTEKRENWQTSRWNGRLPRNWTEESGHGKELLRDKTRRRAASTCPVWAPEEGIKSMDDGGDGRGCSGLLNVTTSHIAGGHQFPAE